MLAAARTLRWPLAWAAALLAPAVVLADPAAPEPPRLTGVIVAGPSRQAIFAEPEGAVIADEGDQVGQFTVHAIHPGEVELRAPNGLYRLEPTPDGAIRQALIYVPPLVPLIDWQRRERELENDQ